MRKLPDDNLSYPVLLEIGNGRGSGFYFRTEQKMYLVTALHVLFEKEGRKLKLRDSNLIATSYDKDLTITLPIVYLFDLNILKIMKNSKKDIVLIELAKISVSNKIISWNAGVKYLSKHSAHIVVVPPQHLKKFNDVLISNDVYVLGYPSSLSNSNKPQIEFNKPLLRKGIIAGKNSQNETIILDCPVYFGNSGGLAIEIEENPPLTHYWVIGVVSQFIPFIEKLESKQLGYSNINIENSGYSVVVPIDTILKLITK